MINLAKKILDGRFVINEKKTKSSRRRMKYDTTNIVRKCAQSVMTEMEESIIESTQQASRVMMEIFCPATADISFEGAASVKKIPKCYKPTGGVRSLLFALLELLVCPYGINVLCWNTDLLSFEWLQRFFASYARKSFLVIFFCQFNTYFMWYCNDIKRKISYKNQIFGLSRTKLIFIHRQSTFL